MRAKTRQARRAAARGNHAAGRARVIWFALGALTVTAFAAVLALAPLRSASTTAPSDGEALVSSGAQQVVVTMAGFVPSRLAGRAGEDLTLAFVNPDSRFHTDGGGWHQFRVEALDIDVKIPPRTRQTVRLQDLPAGTYEFYCDVCCGGKENPAMRGVLEVAG